MKHILLIDDDDALRYLLGKALTRLGLRVTSVSDGTQALRIENIDGALIDLKLGSENGLNLISPLRARHPHAKLVILTGYASIATAVEAMRRGADDYLVKPTDPTTIADLLQASPEAKAQASIEISEYMPPSIRRIKWEHLQRVLAEHGGNIARTAKALGVDRSTVYRMLDKRPVKS